MVMARGFANHPATPTPQKNHVFDKTRSYLSNHIESLAIHYAATLTKAVCSRNLPLFSQPLTSYQWLAMSTPVKSRFSEYEDVLILREVNARLPFKAKRGLVMVGWAAVAEAVASQEEFSRPGFDAKRAQNRFILLLDGHRNRDDESMRASGVAEDCSEKSQLLDELSSVYDDWK
ncbi:hypothetical protein DYB36_008790 [Aphanomyces astaci]|uniref:Uncharacterized protein n=1 Tax=Aphanomyces astaci TaxID=112090 RepID=A0A397B144_APHAT|nr:hypothetical protein DYB36_008790 [Aphanomyces astaci]